MGSFMLTKDEQEKLKRRAAVMEQELAEIRNLFAHLAPSDEPLGVVDLCRYVLMLQTNQAHTIENYQRQFKSAA